MMKKIIVFSSMLCFITAAMDDKRQNSPSQRIAHSYVISMRNNLFSIVFYNEKRRPFDSKQNLTATNESQALQDAAKKLNIQLAEKIEREPNFDIMEEDFYKTLYPSPFFEK